MADLCTHRGLEEEVDPADSIRSGWTHQVGNRQWYQMAAKVRHADGAYLQQVGTEPIPDPENPNREIVVVKLYHNTATGETEGEVFCTDPLAYWATKAYEYVKVRLIDGSGTNEIANQQAPGLQDWCDS